MFIYDDGKVYVTYGDQAAVVSDFVQFMIERGFKNPFDPTAEEITRMRDEVRKDTR